MRLQEILPNHGLRMRYRLPAGGLTGWKVSGLRSEEERDWPSRTSFHDSRPTRPNHEWGEKRRKERATQEKHVCRKETVQKRGRP